MSVSAVIPQNAPSLSVLGSEPSRPVNMAGVTGPVERPVPAVRGKDSGSQQAETPQSGSAERAREEADTRAVIAQLRARDQQVRAHEMAHLAAAGAYATSGANYTYQTGPDGRKYAVGGEVGIDVSPERDPEATIRKMQVVQQAALAPADPSAQDMRVAAMAAQAMLQAQQQLQERPDATQATDQTRHDASSDAQRSDRREGGAGSRIAQEASAAQQAWRVRLRIQQRAG